MPTHGHLAEGCFDFRLRDGSPQTAVQSEQGVVALEIYVAAAICIASVSASDILALPRQIANFLYQDAQDELTMQCSSPTGGLLALCRANDVWG